MSKTKNDTKNAKKKRGFTDRMYVYNLRFAVFLTLCAVVQSFLSPFYPFDTSVWVYILAPVWAEVGVYSAFNIHKAKIENLNKHKDFKSQVQEMQEDIQNFEGGIETVDTILDNLN